MFLENFVAGEIKCREHFFSTKNFFQFEVKQTEGEKIYALNFFNINWLYLHYLMETLKVFLSKRIIMWLIT